MTNVAKDRKKSDFVQADSIPDGSTLDFVSEGTNYKISKEDVLTELGATGTISQLGDPTQTPILNIDGTDNQIRNLEDGPGVKASVSAYGGAKLEHNFTQDSTGAEILTDITADSPTFRSLVAGTGAAVTESGDTIEISLVSASSKTELITVEADFPTPVGGAITLEADTIYICTNDITTSSRFIMSENSVLSGSDGMVITLTYTGSDSMITGEDVTFKLSNIGFACASGQFIEVEDTTSSAVVQMLNCRIHECDVFGTVEGVNVFTMSRILASDCKTNGLTFSGNNAIIAIDTSIATINGGTLVDLGSSTTSGFSVTDCYLISSAGTTIFSGLADSGNINTGGLGSVINTRSLGAGTVLNNISPFDALWDFQHNANAPDSRTSALGYNSGVTVAISAANTPVKIGATWVTEEESRFSVSSSGTFTYIGTGDAITMHATVSATVSGSSARDCTFYWFKNGVEITASGILRQLDTTDAGALSLLWGTTLETNDYIEVFVENNDSTDDVVIDNIIVRLD